MKKFIIVLSILFIALSASARHGEYGIIEDNIFSKNYDLSSYAKGSYLVKVVCDEGAHYVNVVVQ